MARGRVYNKIYNEEDWQLVNPLNKEIMEDYKAELKQNQKSNGTILQYYADWKIVMLYIYRKLNMTLREYIQGIGFKLMKSGSGLVKHYDDGEITSSQFEYHFTNYLRDIINLKFNSDYQRNIRYKTFISWYSGLMDCDYIIKYKDKLIYIEIAGILRDYKEWYLNDKPLNSKSKEKYRLKLKDKENMFKESGVEYYILFPSDLNEDTYKKIFN